MRRWLVLLVLAIRVTAASALMFGPWTDEASELAGWDANRFQAIHDASGQPWIDHDVEYPPGSVALIEVIAAGGGLVGGGVVGTQRLLVALSLGVDVGVAGLLERHRRDAGLAYLVLGTAAVPAGLLRLDLWAAGCTAIGLVLLAGQPRSQARSQRRSDGLGRSLAVGVFALAVAAGAAIKVSPGLLIPVAFAVRRRAEALAALAIGAAAGAAWLLWAGAGALTQVTSLRGVTGWHVESVPGSLVALLGGGAPRFEADAYRIGTLDADLVLAGRVVTGAVLLGLCVLARRTSADRSSSEDSAAPLAMLGSTAALIVTAPLLSPQFLLWLTPAAALAWACGQRRPAELTGGAIALTALTLAIFGPPGTDHPIAATLLLLRDGLLIGIVVSCALGLRSQGSQPG